MLFLSLFLSSGDISGGTVLKLIFSGAWEPPPFSGLGAGGFGWGAGLGGGLRPPPGARGFGRLSAGASTRIRLSQSSNQPLTELNKLMVFLSSVSFDVYILILIYNC
jgi:hypothetical protein